MLFQPAIQFGCLPVGLQEFSPRFGCAERGPDYQAVGGTDPLPRKPRGQFADDPPVFLMKPELNLLSNPSFGPIRHEQPPLDAKALSTWASGFGVGLTLFHGWPMVVDQILFWPELPKPEAAILAVERIEARLIAVEASPEAVTRWQSLVRAS